MPPAPLSRRTAFGAPANRVAERLEAARAAGRDLLDLAESNPTRCGLAWPAPALAAALARGDLAAYRPTPAGAPAAREAVAGYLGARGAAVDPARVLLAASSSEIYGWLLKLLCDPGDAVLVPAPSYPLLDVLCRLEAVRLDRYPLRYDGEWHLDLGALAEAVTPRTRAVVVVSPGNPTGAVLSAAELAGLERLCAERGLALVGDEVFADSALAPAPTVAGCREALAFHVSGLSKVCGLPQLKVAWLAAAGPAADVARALERLEMVADAYLSPSGPAQAALPELLRARGRFLAPLRARLDVNRQCLSLLVEPGDPFGPLRGQGGWSAVLRVGQTLDEERLALELLERGVAVQPGFFYDFARPGHLVLSLLPEPGVFEEGARVVVTHLRGVAHAG